MSSLTLLLSFFGALWAQNTPPSGYRWEFIPEPSGTTVSAAAISNQGVVVGVTGTQSYIRNANGSVQVFAAPGATSTIARDINSAGTVVGSFTDFGGVIHGFQRTDAAAFTTIDAPGATRTELIGINDGGLILGRAEISGVTRYLQVNNGAVQLLETTLFAGALLDLVSDGTMLGFSTSPVALGEAANYSFVRAGQPAEQAYTCTASRGGFATVGVNDLLDLAIDCTTIGPGFFRFNEKLVRFRNGQIMMLFRSSDGASRSYTLHALTAINRNGQLLGSGEIDGDGLGIRNLILTPCDAALTTAGPIRVPPSGDTGTLRITAPPGCRANVIEPVTMVTVSEAGLGDSNLTYTVGVNTSGAYREAEVKVGNSRVLFTQEPTPLASCQYTLSLSAGEFNSEGGGTVLQINTADGCPWTISGLPDWLSLGGSTSGTGSRSFFSAQVLANPGTTNRAAVITAGGRQVTVRQLGQGVCDVLLNTTTLNFSHFAWSESLRLVTNSTCAWTAVSQAGWLTFESPASGTTVTGIGPRTLWLRTSENTGTYTRTTTLTINGQIITVNQRGISESGFPFVPVAPCRVADTRQTGNKSGPFGPPRLAANLTRAFPLPASGCGIPTNARAVSVNITVVPPGYLGYLSAWENGQPRPLVSTLNSWNGRVVANAAIIPTDANGSINLYASNDTDVVIDVNGYFRDPSVGSLGEAALAFYPVTPCRLADTRITAQTIPATGGERTFDVVGRCGIPATARAYAMNLTAVPPGYLGYVTIWPAGSERPFVSTLNSWDGTVVANAAIVPAGAGGAVSVYGSNATDIVLDLNGYFAPPGEGGLNFFKLTPCRVADTRAGEGKSGAFGPPSIPAQSTRTMVIPQSGCNAPEAARAYSLNLTAIPATVLSYLSVWPTGAPQPLVSTLNSWNGQVVANAAIVPAGANSAVSFYLSNLADLVVDINGFFAP